MSWSRKNVYEIESHPFEPCIPTNAQFLIIGTFPTHRNNLLFPFFYSGKDNSFWNIMEQVFNCTFKNDSGEKAVIERQLFLASKKIGITDMLKMCYRKNCCSTDENLFPIILNDIFSLLDEHKSVRRLVLTSRTEIHGALGLLKTYFLQKGIILDEPVKTRDKMLEGRFNHNGREIEILVPYSPSP